MSQSHIDNEEVIYIKPLLDFVKKVFKRVLKTLVYLTLFYKRKAILFIVISIVGVIAGYFLDKKLKRNKIITQEIIIEPKYDFGKYMYKFIEELNINLKDSVYTRKIGIDKDQKSKMRKVDLEPIIEVTDLLDGLHLRYGDKEDFHNIIENYNDQKLEENKYINFYKYHKLTFFFKNESKENNIIPNIILNYIRGNKYYNEKLSLDLQQTKSNLKKTKETLAFVEEYLDRLNKNTTNEEKEIVVFAKESEIPTVSSLLERKDILLTTINDEERMLALDKNLFEIVEYGDVISKKEKVIKKMITILPLALCGLVSLIFFSIKISSKISDYIKD